MAQYRSRATSSGFRGYTLPDTARNFEEAETRRLQQLKEAYAEKRRSDQIVNQTKLAQNRAVENQLDTNQSLEQSYKEAYKTSMKQRFDTETRDLQRQQEARNSVTDRLSAFSKTLLKEAGSELQRRKESEQAFGRNLIYQFGADPEDLKALNTIEGNLQAESSANLAVVRKLKDRGATPDQINNIRNLDGWRLYGAEIEMAQQGKSTYESFLKNDEVRNRTVKLGDGRELTLNQAAENMETDAYNSIKAILRNEFIEDNFSTLNQSFADKYLYKGMRDVDQTDFTQYQNDNKERLKDIEKIEYTDQVGKIQSTGVSPQQFIINQNGSDKGPGLKLQRDKYLTEAASLAQSGIFDRNALENLRESLWIQDGKSKTFAQQFENNATVQSQLQDIVSKINAYEKEENAAKEQVRSQKNSNFQDTLIEQWSQTNNAQRGEAFELLKKEPYQIKPVLQALFDNKDLTPVTVKQQAIDSILYGYNLSPAEIEVLGKSEEVFAREMFNSSGQLKGEFNVEKQATRLANEFLKSNETATDNNVANNSNVSEASKVIQADIRRRFELNLKTQPSVPEAFRVTEIEIRTKIESNKGKYEMLMPNEGGNKTKFNVFKFQTQPDVGVLRNEFISNTVSATKANPQYLVDKTDPNLTPENKQVLIDEINATRRGRTSEWIRDQFKFAQQGSDGQPGFVGNLRDYLNQIQKVQLLDVKPLQEEANLLFDLPNNPVITPLLESYNTLQPTNLLATQIVTTQAGAKGMQQYRPALDLIASVESNNDTLYNGYDALNKGGNGSYVIGTNTGTNVFNQSLTTMTVGDIRQLQRQGKLFAAGRYQFLESTLEDIFDRGLAPGIDDSSLFDQDTQDRLGVAYIKDTISTYRDNNGDVVDGMGQRFVGLQKVPKEKIKAALDTFQSAVVGTPFENIDVIPEVAEQLERSGTGALTFTGNKMRYQKAGKTFQAAGFTVREQSLFDKVDPVHSGNSYHNFDEAFDITHQEGDYATSIAKTKRLKEVVRGLNLFKEVIGPGDYEAGLWKDRSHDEHLHLGGLLRPITQEDIDAINSVK